MKEFRVAHIVPVSHLEDTVSNQYHMCLAHLIDDENYREHFKRMSKLNKFILMDNGAAEGVQLTPEELMRAYEIINPTEIILPDILYKAGDTIQKSFNFLELFEKRGLNKKYGVMAVPQGEDEGDWTACACIFVKDPRIDTIGIPKHLVYSWNNKCARVKACDILEKLFNKYDRKDMEVHLLGCNEGPLVVKSIHESYKFVRGCDSAFSYLQVQIGKMMSLTDDSRPEGYIDFINGKNYTDFNKYMDNFNNYAGVINNGYSTSWM